MGWFGSGEELETSKKENDSLRAQLALEKARNETGIEENKRLETKYKEEMKQERQKQESKYEVLEKKFDYHQNQAQIREAQLRIKVDDLNKYIRDLSFQHQDAIARVQKECQARIDSDKNILREEYDKRVNLVQQIKTEQNDQLVQVYRENLAKRTIEVEQLSQDNKSLFEQFKLSKNDFKDYFKIKPQNDIHMPEHLKTTIQKAKRELELDTKKFYNIAFVGHTKTGKSSLINAIRGIPDDHRDAAKVEVEEATHKIQPYAFTEEELRHVKIYDVPGAGTITHDAKSYYNDKYLCAFDCLVIVTQDALCRDEIEFASQSIQFNQPIVFVRSRFDIAMYNEVKNKRIEEINQYTIVSQIKKSVHAFAEELEKTGKDELLKVPIFFVSCHTLRELMQGQRPTVIYQEKQFLEYIKAQSKFSRNIIDF